MKNRSEDADGPHEDLGAGAAESGIETFCREKPQALRVIAAMQNISG